MRTSKIPTREYFEKWYGDRDWNWYRNFVAEGIIYGMPGQWLDVGAGLGLFVECARRFGINCIGLEGSEWAVNEAKKRFSDINMRQHFLEDKFPFEDNSISTITCLQVIEHISKDTAIFMLKECYRILKHDGVLFIHSPNKYNREGRVDKTHINLYTPSSLIREIENAGFKVIKTPNSTRIVLGNSRIAKKMAGVIFKLFPFDYLSASANCIAVKH